MEIRWSQIQIKLANLPENLTYLDMHRTFNSEKNVVFPKLLTYLNLLGTIH